MQRYDILCGLWIGLMLLAPCEGRAAEKRIALVVGNAAYRHTSELKNPKNDAVDMAEALQKLDFTVIASVDLDKVALDRRLREFAEALPGADIAVFFYAGHGLQVAGRNYLIPVDAKLSTQAALDFEMVPLDLVQRIMEREAKASILFLDACRDNPLGRSLARAMGTRSAEVGRGLAGMDSAVGSLIGFSTQPGNVALDGEGRNSPFAAALSKHLVSPDDDLSGILIKVRNDVVRATARKQIPWENSSLWMRLYFTPPAGGAVEAPKPAPPGTEPEARLEIAFWETVKDSGDPAALRTYLDRFPQGTFANLARVLIARLQRTSEQRAATETTADKDPTKEEAERAKGSAGPRGAQEDKTAARPIPLFPPPSASKAHCRHGAEPDRRRKDWRGRQQRSKC
ncbi:MAG: caspase family protein [Hyphomicrobiaceae bacterium]